MIYTATSRNREFNDIASTETVAEPETFNEDQFNVRLLNGEWLKPADTPQREAVDFLEKLERTSTDEGQAAFMQLVDFDTHLVRYYESYRFELNYATQRELRDIAFEDFDMPKSASDFRVAAIEKTPSQDLMVYAYARAGDIANTPYVFQLNRKHNGELQLVDWREIPEGIWASELNGLSVGPMLSDTQRFAQEAMYDDLNEADRHINARNYQAAETALKRAEDRDTLFRLHDRSLYLIALRWFWMYRQQDALRLCNQAHQPAAFPWIDYLKAEIYSRERDYQAALRSIASYEQNAGFHFDLAEIKLRALTALAQKQQAAEVALQMLAHLPNSNSSLRAALLNVPSERLPEVFAHCSGDDENMATLASVASSLLYDRNTKSHAALRAFVADKAPDSAYLAEIDGDRFYFQGKFQQSLEAYQRRLKLVADDEDLAYDALNSYLSAATQIMSWQDIYRAVDDPARLMETLYYDVAYDQEYISPESFEKLMALHQQEHSDDSVIYDVWLANHHEDWAKVVELGEKALEKLKSNNAEEYEQSEIEYNIASARYHLDQWKEAYEKSPDKPQAYSRFAGQMMANEDFAALTQLNQMHGENHNGLLLKFYKLRVTEHQAAEANDSKILALVLQDYQMLHSKCEGSQELFPYTVASRIDHLIVHSDNWKTLLTDAQWGGRLFHQFVRRFQGEGDLKGLNEFLTLYAETYPNDQALDTYYAQFHWRHKQHEKVIETLSPWPPEPAAVAAPIYTWRPLRIKSQLAIDDIAGAQATLDSTSPGDNLELMVQMASGNTDRVEEILADKNARATLSIPIHNDWLRGQRMQRFMQSEAFAELREKHPPTTMAPLVEKRALIFFAEAPSWSEETIKTNFENANIKGVEVAELTHDNLVSQTFRLNTFTSELLVTVGDDRFTVDGDYYYLNALPPQMKKAVAAHASWATVETVGDSAALSPEKFTQILSAFTQAASAIHVMHAGEVDRAMVFKADTPAEERTAAKIQNELRGETLPLLPFANADQYDRAKTIALNKRLQAGVESNPPQAVKIRLRHGSAVEEHWCDVEKIEHESWGSYRFIGRLQTSSELVPQWKQGDVVRLRNYDIQDWRD